MTNQRSFELVDIVKETQKVSTFFFKFNKIAEPGQFLMVWVPGSEEVPMSVAYSDKKSIAISVAAIGPASNSLHAKKIGDYIGLRGPFGKPFTLKIGTKRIALVAGGYGAAPLGLFAERIKSSHKEVQIDSFLGARTREDLLFVKRLEKVSTVYISTNDGSTGHKGLVIEPFEQELKKKKFDCVYTCGPEMMEKAIFDICAKNNLDLQASLERIMKCGFGICGSCMMDDLILCIDGPVVEMRELKRLKEFGVSHRDKAGVLQYWKK